MNLIFPWFLLAALAAEPFLAPPEALSRIREFQDRLAKARSEMVDSEAELAKLQEGIESEADALRRLKGVPPEKRSVLVEAEIRSRSKKARELAEKERQSALRARDSRAQVAEHAATLEVLVADLIDKLIHKMEMDLNARGSLLQADSESFADWAMRHRRYQELYLSLVPASAEWQERLPRDLRLGQEGKVGSEWLIQGWREILERKLFRMRDRRALLANEEKIRAKMDKLLHSGSGRFELGPPQSGPSKEGTPRSMAEIKMEIQALDGEIMSLERKVQALSHLQASREGGVEN